MRRNGLYREVGNRKRKVRKQRKWVLLFADMGIERLDEGGISERVEGKDFARLQEGGFDRLGSLR